MLELHQFPPNKRTINFSPYCLKLETHLRLACIPFRSVYSVNTRRNPKGKMPYLVEEGRVIPDSQHCVEHLTKKHGDKLDAHLTPAQRAEARVIRRMLEEALSPCLVYGRWIDDDGWEKLRAAVFAKVPAPVRTLVSPLVRNRVRKMLIQQGTGRHTPAEIFAMGEADLDAVAHRLGDGPYFFGAEPSSLDAVAFGFLNNLVNDIHDGPLKRRARSHANLVAYCERIAKRCYPPA